MNDISQPEAVEEERVSEATDMTVHEEREPAAQLTRTIAPAMDILGIIAMAATDPRVDVIKMQALLDMQQRVLAKQAEADFNAALGRMNTDKLRVAKNGTVTLGETKGSYKFATWDDMDRVIRPIMQREGFILSFDSTERQGGGIVVTGTLLHSSGHSKSASIPLALDTGPGRNNLQAMGSTLSYGKRYTAEMLLNIVREGTDDDGKTGGMKFITKEQVEEITALVNSTETDPQAFLEWVFSDEEPHNYSEIPAEKFVGVLNALKGKQRRMKMEGKAAQ